MEARLTSSVTPAAGEGLHIAAVALGTTRAAVWWDRIVACGEPYVASCRWDNSEAVDVYVRSGSAWTREATFDVRAVSLTSFSAAAGRWGRSPLAMTDDTLVIGEPWNNTYRSSLAFVYQRSGASWTLASTLSGQGDPYDQFGGAVAIDGPTIVVSAGHEWDPAQGVKFGYEPGAAYVFRKTAAGWTREARLASNDALSHFGSHLAISGDTIAAGGPGSAFIFERGTGNWSKRSLVLTVPPPGRGDYGWLDGLSLDGDIAAVHRVTSLSLPGWTDVFRRNGATWSLVASATVRGAGDGLLRGRTVIGSTSSLSLEAFTLDAPQPAPAPQITVSHPSLYMAARGGIVKAAPQTERVTISGAGNTAMRWSVSVDPYWLTVTPATGTGNGSFTVSVPLSNRDDSIPLSPLRAERSVSDTGLDLNLLSYPVGTIKGTITVDAVGAAPATIDVTFTNYAANGPAPVPWGSLDTPAAGATNVTGSIPVTGWALDQMGVKQVDIYRDAVAGETAAGGRVLIGTAVQVEGARPDLEAQPYPGNYRAGWGLMVLSNMLPNGGNGNYTFRAIATSVTGTSAEIGQKTITCTNASAILPFGAIDTPGQGETVSGTIMNWGWALAPQPFSINPDGSGLEVYVDGAYLGHPTYNVNRADIAGLFPGRKNSTGSVGYLSIDTTRFANGVHTIAWLVRDQNGHADGIGSRYFTVQNATTAALTMNDAGSSQLAASLAAGPTGVRAVRTRLGFDLEREWQEVEANDTGNRLVAATELERVELSLGERGFAAAMLAGSRLGTLPAGSRFDAETGTLVWQPGVGFAGRYDFVFTRGDERVPVTVMLGAKHAAASQVEFTIDTPVTGSVADGVVTVAGWAFDRDARRGSGVDVVHIWAYPVDGGAPIFAGAAALGRFRPDVAAAGGSAGATSGFGLTIGHLPAGTYDLAVFPRSTATGAFANAQVVRVTIK